MQSNRRVFIIFLAIIILVGVVGLLAFNFRMLNILTGYAAKNAASSLFIGQRSLEFTQAHDNNFSPVNLASLSVDKDKQSVSASFFGLAKRTAIYRQGVGCVLLPNGFNTETSYQKPNRIQTKTNLPYPYGDLPQKDTLFVEVDYEALQQAIDAAFENNEVQKTRSLLVIYKDQIIGEQYAEGYDQNSPLLGWSMTKSILATCFGILQYRGGIDINKPAPVKAWQNDDRRHITIHDLLQMNSGLDWEEAYGNISDATKMLFLAKDVTIAQAEKEVLHPPRTHWNYSSGTSNLLSGIFRQQFEQHQYYLDFPYEALIDRIGMRSMVMETDVSSNYIASSYSWATTRDWAKLGLLYLHRGNWNGQQIFDSTWVDYVATPAPNSEGVYGGHFWLNAQGAMPDLPTHMFYASGFQGQYVAVFPSQDLVIARLGLAEAPDFDMNQIFGGIMKAIKK